MANFFSRLFKREATSPRLGAASLVGTTPKDLRRYTRAGVSMQVATVYRCVRLLSESVAALPFRCLKRGGGLFVPDAESRVNYLLTVSPSRDIGAFDFWMQAVQHVLLYGNAYIVPVYGDDDLNRLVLITPGCVYQHNREVGYYRIFDKVNGISGRYFEREIIHIKGQNPEGGDGESVISFARRSLGIAGTAEAETFDRFANGGSVRGFISGAAADVGGYNDVSDAEVERYAKDVDEALRNGGRIIGLSGKAQFSPLAMTAIDMQFLETRKFTVREICRFFGVHPSYVFDDTSNNYKSAEMANVAFLSNTLNPLLLKIENEFNRKLIPEEEWGRAKFEFDRNAIYTLDLDSRANYFGKMIGNGIYSVNDCRRMVNVGEVAGGDKAMISANLKPLEEIGQKKQTDPKQKQ